MPERVQLRELRIGFSVEGGIGAYSDVSEYALTQLPGADIHLESNASHLTAYGDPGDSEMARNDVDLDD